jgi:leukotriene-A4 hydrolase
MERLLQQALHGPAERDFSYIIGRKALTEALKTYENNPKYQRLVIHYEVGTHHTHMLGILLNSILRIDKFGEDPDDAYSSIPYEKGSNFILYLGSLVYLLLPFFHLYIIALNHLERLLGGLDVFVPYVKDYVTTFRGKSIRTEQWKEHLYSYFRQNGGQEKIRLLDSVDWNVR